MKVELVLGKLGGEAVCFDGGGQQLQRSPLVRVFAEPRCYGQPTASIKSTFPLNM